MKQNILPKKFLNHAGTFWRLTSATFAAWSHDKGQRLGAALAYYSIFSIGPLVIVFLAISGFFFGEQALRGELFGQLRGLLGDEGAAAIQLMAASAYKPTAGTVAGILSVVTLMIGATGVVVELKDALNTIWQVEEKPNGGIKQFVSKYILSIAAIIGIGFLLTISLVVSAAISALGRFSFGDQSTMTVFLQLINFSVSLLILTALFAVMFKYLPDCKVQWINALQGGALTALLFSISKLVIGLYLGRIGVTSSYGAAGSIVVILIWIYFSAQIFFFGAEFTKISTHWRENIPQSKNSGTSLANLKSEDGGRVFASIKDSVHVPQS